MKEYVVFSSPYPITGEPLCFAGEEHFVRSQTLSMTFIDDVSHPEKTKTRNIEVLARLSVEEIIGVTRTKLNKSVKSYPTDARITKST